MRGRWSATLLIVAFSSPGNREFTNHCNGYRAKLIANCYMQLARPFNERIRFDREAWRRPTNVVASPNASAIVEAGSGIATALETNRPSEPSVNRAKKPNSPLSFSDHSLALKGCTKATVLRSGFDASSLTSSRSPVRTMSCKFPLTSGAQMLALFDASTPGTARLEEKAT